jgi:hypothetical protein
MREDTMSDEAKRLPKDLLERIKKQVLVRKPTEKEWIRAAREARKDRVRDERRWCGRTR